ncbi:HAD family hydrolase [Gillisia limnaea]|uniref:HAD-superfamily hydrolase, subfamily IA, variant 3 n=1 Tax=Gillisia limnaea (strain DSM 15749 / LMG 21470 / R-8282) TaxID=865937 RepID=H2BWJ8_GILLR|nr:HAD family phosphatase [Gillisia limnaea]EHQ01941.1 HAD-superfamily hydrolase, subfamily IA, variant 3 [Gillisia limnaea DSM 15749]
MIKTIIFDFGDIFVNLDKAATFRELEKFAIKKLPEVITRKNLEYEKGLISSEEFLNSYKNEFGLEHGSITNSWNAILIDFPEYRFNFIKKLSEEKEYQLILLSNTNEIHIEWIIKNVPFFEKFKTCFDAFYLSHEINLRKPDINIYEFVLKTHNLNPEDCLFIDDTKENTEAASAMGIHTWNLNPSREDVIDLFTIKKELF